VSGAGCGRLAEVAGAVLLGGASARMGRDKAALELGGASFAARIARLLASLCEDVLLVGGEPPPDASGRRVADLDGPRCALRGVASALAATRAERVLVIATDLPLVTADLLLALIAHPQADVVLPRGPRGAEPLCALWRREPALAAATASLAAGRLAVRGLFDALEVAWLEGADLARVDPDGAALLNANEPADLERVRQLATPPNT
jgi:molybdopterin-guanine dinucleotide biosynthesis protein A